MSHYVVTVKHREIVLYMAESDTVFASTEVQTLAKAITEEGFDLTVHVMNLCSQADLAHYLRNDLRKLRGDRS